MRSFQVLSRGWPVLVLTSLTLITPAWAGINVLLTEVPDYAWDAGCFGTATGNLMGYWDRHGFPNFYTGPTDGGVAPLNSDGPNQGIRSLWASRAGLDGRPAMVFGHMDDYWVVYESTDPDPYLTAGRKEHTPDSIGDFTGLNQNKWPDLNGECAGNIDGFSFVFWDGEGGKRVNYTPRSASGTSVPDIPSGLKTWTEWRGSEAEVFSQIVDFNPALPPNTGFTFEDLRAEIDAGFPVLLFLQGYKDTFRSLPGMERANPNIHGMLAYGYYISDDGDQYVRYKTSWGGSGDNTISRWNASPWQADLPVRGVIGFHPRARITGLVQQSGGLTIEWEAPSSTLYSLVDKTSTPLHWYVVEKATTLNPADFQPISTPTTDRIATVPNCCPDEAAFFRVKLVSGPQ